MKLELLSNIYPENTVLALTVKKGIYFWFNKGDDTLVYIGIALGVGGLRKRIVGQHLNPKYLEFRPDKQSEKDKYQLEHPIRRLSKNGGVARCGIDKSAFRKAIGRKLKLKPGVDTVNYILENLYLKVFESEDINFVKALEVELINKYEPLFNTSHNPKKSHT